MEYVLFIIGLILLTNGANWLVDGSAALAKRHNIPSIVIGLTVVAMGTSLPELVVNLIAAINGNTDIALGNVIGSNIANTLVIIGVTAIIVPIVVKKNTVWKEIPISFFAVVVLAMFILFGSSIGRSQGIILLSFFVLFIYYIWNLTKKGGHEQEEVIIKDLSKEKIAVCIIGGLLALYIGGKWTVDGAIAFAKLLGMSEYFISLTVIALGTSLPELVTSIVAVRKKNMDLAIGNAVGSNILNIFWILGITAVISPIHVSSAAISDIGVLLLATVALFMFMFIGKKYTINRGNGMLLMMIYIVYIVYIIMR